jgi:hypothetical protein
MRSTTILVFILFSILFLSCKTNPTNEAKGSNTANNGIVGKWQWTRTSGGITGKIIKASPNQLAVVQFTSDGNYYSFSHDTLTRSTRYSIRKGTRRDTLIWEDMTSYRQIILVLTTDTLCLSDPGADGFSSDYIRILH